MSSPLWWVHEDPKYAIEETIKVPASYSLLNILGVGPCLSEFFKQMYNITTIGELEDHIINHGFPSILKPETKFVLSVRIGLKWCVD